MTLINKVRQSYDNDFQFASRTCGAKLEAMEKDQKNAQKAGKLKKRSCCPISGFLDILGDKWTLLVVRDLYIGLTLFSDFQSAAEGIPTNILSERLKRLQQAGIINKTRYQDHPVRYEYHLTEKGRRLSPVLKAMMEWSGEYLPDILSKEEIKQIATERLAASKIKQVK